MESRVEVVQRTRVKACSECRQQKLKCDASKDYSQPCSRCKRLSLQCIISKTFQRVKRRTKGELLAELEALKQQYNATQCGPATQMQHTSPQYSRHSQESQNVEPLSGDQLLMGYSQDEPQQRLEGNEHTLDDPNITFDDVPQANDVFSTQQSTTISRTLQDLTVDAGGVDACFSIFIKHHLQYVPVVETNTTPNECYKHSPLLFWTIVYIGARRYSQDPTLILSLAPKVVELARQAVFSCDRLLSTIQSFALLCAWPVPVDTLDKDLTAVIAGSMIQMAMSIGLHVYGVGQDFSRTKLYNRGQYYRDYRARLWALCIIIFQNVNNTRGTPPMLVPDTYDYERTNNDVQSSLPPGVRFQKGLSYIQSSAILEIERKALSQQPEMRSASLDLLIDSTMSKLSQLSQKCPSLSDRFWLLCAQIQIASFHLLTPQTAPNNSKLSHLYAIGLDIVETFIKLDQAESFALFVPQCAITYLNLTALILLRIGRSHIREELDTQVGRRAFFQVLDMNKKTSVRADDTWARATIILGQLWTSKFIPQHPHGDSLFLRCRSRLGMSVVYDCYWWWRQEFQGHPDPYEDVEDASTTDDLSRSIRRTPDTNSMIFMGIGWSPQDMSNMFAWPIHDDMITADWTNMESNTGADYVDFDGVPPENIIGN